MMALLDDEGKLRIRRIEHLDTKSKINFNYKL